MWSKSKMPTSGTAVHPSDQRSSSYQPIRGVMSYAVPLRSMIVRLTALSSAPPVAKKSPGAPVWIAE